MEKIDAEFEVSEDDNIKTVEEDFNSWLSTLEDVESGYSTTLYKYKNQSTKFTLVYQWENEIPEGHDIGLRFGSGRYNLVVRLRDGSGKTRNRSYKFEIDSIYDQLRKQQRIDPSTPLGFDQSYQNQNYQNNQHNQNFGIDQSLQLFERVIGLLVPLIDVNNKKTNNHFDPGNFMMKTYESVGDVLKNTMIQQAQLVQDITKQTIIHDEEEEEEKESGNDFIEMLKPFLETFIPVLKKDNVGSRVAANQIKKLPQYKQLLGNKVALNQVIKFLEEKEGIEETDKILRNLKIRKS